MVVLAVAIVVAVLPGILILEAPRLACATAKEVTADPNHPDNQLTVSNGSIVRVTVPRSAWPFGTFPDMSSSNSAVLAGQLAPCGGQASADAMSFDFKAVAEGSAQLQTVGPSPFSLFGFAWTPQVWDVTVGPDYGPILLVGIEAAAAALALAFIFYRRRQGLVVTHASDPAG
jgi:uncharacterized protein YjeT (DUF2065 family)